MRKASAVTGPTPGTVIKRWRGRSVGQRRLDHQQMQSGDTPPGASRGSPVSASTELSNERIRLLGQSFMMRARESGLDCTLPTFRPKGTQGAANIVLHVDQLAHHQLAATYQHAQPLRLQALDMHHLVPTQTHQLGDTTGIVAIGLVAHGRQRNMGVPCFNHDGFQPRPEVRFAARHLASSLPRLPVAGPSRRLPAPRQCFLARLHLSLQHYFTVLIYHTNRCVAH